MSDDTFDPDRSFGIGGFNFELAIRTHAPTRIKKIEQSIVDLNNQKAKLAAELKRLKRLVNALKEDT